MASTALTIISNGEGKTVARFLRKSFGHVSGYSHTLLAFMSGAEIRSDRPPDAKTYHAMGFLATSLIAHLTPANGDTFLVPTDSEVSADFTFNIYEKEGEIIVRCEDKAGVIFETNATRSS